MEETIETLNEAPQRELVITRTFNAPRELVWNAWTEKELLEQWWGPKGLKIEVLAFDLQPNGVFHYSMTAANGYAMWGKFVYKDIVAQEQLVFTSAFADVEGNAVKNPFLMRLALETLITVTLEEQDGKTSLTLKGQPIDATQEERDAYFALVGNMEQGFGGTFDKLGEVLAKKD
jgi:uncharacterized protein YndB with AHSA1/START domain